MVKGLLERWPVIRQLRTGADGTGVESMSDRTRNLLPKNQDAEFTRAMCPYCGVGCTLSLHVQDNRIVKVTSPLDVEVTHGHLCIKGRFGFEFVHGGDLQAEEGLETGVASDPGADRGGTG